jgi:Flp pilus assembly protein TadD
VNKSPGKARPLANLGIACAEEGDRKMAEQYLRRSLQQDAIVVTAYENLTTLLNMDRRPLETIQIADEALRRIPNNPRVLHNKGYACLLLNRLREAEAAFHQTISISPDFHLSHVALGSLYLLKKDRGRASHHLRKAASLGYTSPNLDRNIHIAEAAQSGEDIGQ